MRKTILCLVIFCLCLQPCAAHAASTSDANELIDPSASCSLALNYVYDGVAFPDVPIQLYRIATVTYDYQYNLAEPFTATGLVLNGIQSAGEWSTVRSTLESFIIANGVVPLKQANTDSNGHVSFSGLTPGMYFVMPFQYLTNGVCYYYGSGLYAVPTVDDSGSWVYDVTAVPKPNTDVPSGAWVEYKVVKEWIDWVYPHYRPVSIEIEIYCNGKLMETVVLSEENTWSYSWAAVDNGDIWKVAEKVVPDHYTVSVHQNKTSFVVRNQSPFSPPPGGGETPPTGDTANIGLYVMLLCVSGLSLVIVGLAARRKAER